MKKLTSSAIVMSVQQRVYDMGLTTLEMIRKRKTIFFTILLTGILVLPIIFIGVWNGITDFRTAYVQELLFLEILNWYDGIVVDSVWVRYSRFWMIKGTEDLAYVINIKLVFIERIGASVLYLPIAALIAWFSILIAK